MSKKKKSWEVKITRKNEEFINQNLYRIDEFLDSMTAKCIAGNYYKDIYIFYDELKSELHYSLIKIACCCNDHNNAFVWYGPAVFKNTLEEYFQAYIQKEDKLKDPWERKLKDKGRKILLKQRLRYIESKNNTKPFRVLDCKKISRLIRNAGLTKIQIRVFLLKARKDMSLKEISNTLDKSLGTVKTHYYRAINKLKKYTHQNHLKIADVYRSLTTEEILDL